MHQHFRTAALAALFLNAIFASGATAVKSLGRADAPEEKVRSRPKIGVAERVVFSEFDKDNGSLVLELGADTARPSGAISNANGEPEAWSLGKVLLRLYEGGVPSATITTPDCLFMRTTRTASSPGELEFDSEDFRVDGANWRWHDESDRDLITIQNNVRASLKEKPAAKRERTDIFSDRLDIIYHKNKSGTPEAGRTLFVFSGNVRAVMKDSEHGDVLLFGDTLVVRLKNTDARSTKTAKAGAAPAANAVAPLSLLGSAKAGKNTPAQTEAMLDRNLENIVVSGNVRISSEGREMSGDLSSYDQATRIFTTTGHAAVSDQLQALTDTTGQIQGFAASGGQMLWRRKENKIEVFREPARTRSTPAAPTAPAPVPAPPVRLQIPSFAEQERPGRARYGDGYTSLTGDYLVIEIKPNANLAELRGNVHATDEDFVMDAGRILIETPHTKATANLLEMASGAVPAGGAARATSAKSPAAPTPVVVPDTFRVRHITATESVRANYEGRNIRCEKAVISPEKETITLTGEPLLETLGASLRGHLIEMDIRKDGNRAVTVHSTPPAVSGSRQNVQVALPALQKRPTPGKNVLFDSPTRVTANHLVMREIDRKKNNAEFDFTGDVKLDGGGLNGHCDRLGILAYIGGPAPAVPAAAGTKAPAAKPPAAKNAYLARIHKLTAVGNVLLGTNEYTAEGGEAVVFPSVTVQERSPLDDNGLDGPAPLFLTLHPHASTPGKRPRLTFYSKGGLKSFGNLVAPNASAGTAAPVTPAANAAGTVPANTKSPLVPFHVDGDLLEVVGGVMRSRFYLRGNVELKGPDLVGSCDTIEGSIIQELPAKKPATPAGKVVKPPAPEYALTRVIGRGNARVVAQGNQATGRMFEFLPVQDKLLITGAPRIRDKEGRELQNAECVSYNRKTGEWETTNSVGADGQILRPKMIIPLSSL